MTDPLFTGAGFTPGPVNTTPPSIAHRPNKEHALKQVDEKTTSTAISIIGEAVKSFGQDGIQDTKLLTDRCEQLWQWATTDTWPQTATATATVPTLSASEPPAGTSAPPAPPTP
jgi:hypothetical protein